MPDEEYHLLRSSREARVALMDETFGDEGAFSAGTIDEVLAHTRAAVQAEERANTEEERKKRAAAEELAERERSKRVQIEGALRAQVDRRARKLGTVVGWFLAGLLLVAVIVGGIATIPGAPLIQVNDLLWRLIIWICIGVFVVLTVGALVIKGVTLTEIKKAMSRKIESRWRARGHRQLDKLHGESGRG